MALSCNNKKAWLLSLFTILSLSCTILSAEFEAKPDDPVFAKFQPLKAPATKGLIIKTGDRLAICGDSITEQKKYGRIIETYLTACVPDLKVTVRQYGWSGETAEGFLSRMENDCLRFKPTLATTCYGMNDYKYRPYDEANANWYRDRYTSVVKRFKAADVRVVLGSPGCVGKVASWVKSASGTLEEHNLNLCALRNIGIEIADKEEVRFADVFWPMFTASHIAKQKYGPTYQLSGSDGVHPEWAGQLVMAYAFLKAMGLDGNLGTITVDLATEKAIATKGHVVDSFASNVVVMTSSRYPFCASGATNSHDSIRSGMSLVPFNQELNRLRLVVKGTTAANYTVTWGADSRAYTSTQLAQGVNLAADFPINPFSKAFTILDAAVLKKQTFETEQIKKIFHGPEGKKDMEAAVKRTEAIREPLAQAIAAALVPVTHRIRIEASK
jgi:lysophospholipase L1-like esterase